MSGYPVVFHFIPIQWLVPNPITCLINFIIDPSMIPICFFIPKSQDIPLVMTNIAIENGPFIVDLPMKNGDFP